MTSILILTGQEPLSVLEKAGFEQTRIQNNHHFFQHQDGSSTVVPVHYGETIGSGLLAKISHDCDLSREQFQKLL